MKLRKNFWLRFISLSLCVTLFTGSLPSSFVFASAVAPVEEKADSNAEDAFLSEALESEDPAEETLLPEISSPEDFEEAADSSEGDPVNEEDTVSAEGDPVTEEDAGSTEGDPVNEEDAGSTEGDPVNEEDAGSAEGDPVNEEDAGSAEDAVTEENAGSAEGDLFFEENPDEETVDSPALQGGEEDTYSLELDNDEGILNSSGPESAKAGEQVTVDVTLADGFYFYEAIYNGLAGPVPAEEVDKNTYRLTFEMPARDIILFIKSEPLRKVILVQTGHGTISSDRTEGKDGDIVQLTAEPDPGYVLGSWYMTVTDKNGTSESQVSDDNTFRIAWGDMTVRANFVPDITDYAITIDEMIKNGAVSTTDGRNTAKYGESVILSVKPDPGYQLNSLTITDGDGSEVSWNGPGGNEADEYTFKMPSSAVEVTASFAAVYYNIKLIKEEGIRTSDVFVNGAEVLKARLGQQIILNLMANPGYRISKVTWQSDGGEEAEIQESIEYGYGSYAFTLDVPGEVTVHIYTKKIKFDLISDYDNTMGRITFLVGGQETDKAYNNDSVTVDVVALKGYMLSKLYYNAFISDQEEIYRNEIKKDYNGKYSFKMEGSNIKVYADFVKSSTLGVRVKWEDDGQSYYHDDVVVQLQKRSGNQWTKVENMTLTSVTGWSNQVIVPGEAADYRFIELDRKGVRILPGEGDPAEAEFGLQRNRASYAAEYSVVYTNADTDTTISNTLKKQNYTVSAKWGNDVTDKPARIYTVLQIYNTTTRLWTTLGQRKPLTPANNWQEQYADIPILKDTNGNTAYRIRHLNGQSGTNIIYDINDEDNKNNEAVFSAAQADSLEIYVTYRSALYSIDNDGNTEVTYSDPLVKKTFSVRKEWKEAVENKANKNPESIRVQLQKQTGAGRPWEAVQTLEVKGSSWNASFNPVEVTSQNGDWSWRVVELDGASAPIEQDGTLGVDIPIAENGAEGGVVKNTYAVTYSMDYSGNDAGCTVITNTLTDSKSLAEIRFDLYKDYDSNKGNITFQVGEVKRNWAYYGERVTVIAEPKKGYALSNVYTTISNDDGRTWIPDNNQVEMIEDNRAEFTMMDHSTKVYADFDLALNDINIAEAEGIHTSTVYVNKIKALKAKVGDEINVSLLADQGYRIAKVTWQVDGGEEKEIPAPDNEDGYRDFKFTLDAPGEVNVHIYTEKISYDLTSDYDNTKGRISLLVNGQETDRACDGDSVTVDVQEMEGCTLKRLYFNAYLDGEWRYRNDIGKNKEGKYSFIMEAAAVKVYAEFIRSSTLEVRVKWEDSGKNYKHNDVVVQLQKRSGQQWTEEEELILNSGNDWTKSITVQGEAADYRFIELDTNRGQILPGEDLRAEAEFGLQNNRAVYTAEYSVVYAYAGTATTISNNLKKQDLSVSAKWGNDVTDKPARIQAELQIYNNATLRWDSVKRESLTAAKSWQEQFTDIPVLKDTKGNTAYRIRHLNGQAGTNIIYDINDADRKDNEAVFSATQANSLEIYVTYRSAVYSIDNGGNTEVTYSDPLVKKTFSVRKEWKENVENKANKNPESIRVQLQKQTGAGQPWEEVQTQEVKGDSWRASFNPVEETAQNRDWNWRVVELDGDGAPIEQGGDLLMDLGDAENGTVKNVYTVTYDMDYSDNDAGCTVITNTLSGTGSTTLEVKMNWEDGGRNYTCGEVKVALQKRGGQDGQQWIDDRELTLSNGNLWKSSVIVPAVNIENYRFIEKDCHEQLVLPGEDQTAAADYFIKNNGTPYVAEYRASYAVADKTTTITNTLKTQTLTTTALWDPDVYDQPDSIPAELQIYNTSTGRWENVGQRKELTKEGGWGEEFTGIPVLKDDNGNTVYRIRHLNGENRVIYDANDADRQNTEVTYTVVRKSNVNIHLIYRSAEYSFNVENTSVTYSNLVGFKVINIKMVWKGGDEQAPAGLESISAELQQQTGEGQPWTTMKTIELKKESGWYENYAGLIRHTVENRDWNYRVMELNGDRTPVQQNETLTLEFEGAEEGDVIKKTYTVSYDTDDSGNSLGRVIIITNKLIESETLRTFTAKKVWEDNVYKHDQYSEIEVELQKKNKDTGWLHVQTLILKKSNRWEGSFTPLSVEEQVEYRVREKSDDNDLLEEGEIGAFFVNDGGLKNRATYEVSYDVQGNETTITNSLKPTTVFSVKLNWQGEAEEISHDHDVIAVLRYWDDIQNTWVIKEEITLNYAGGWEGSFERVERKDNDKWSVCEKDKNGILIGEGAEEALFTVVQNGEERDLKYTALYEYQKELESYFNDTEITVNIKNVRLVNRFIYKIKKIWEDGEEGYRHDPIKVRLFHQPREEREILIGERTLSEDNNWEASFSLTDDNYEKYFFTEENLSGIQPYFRADDDSIKPVGAFRGYQGENSFEYMYNGKAEMDTIGSEEDDSLEEGDVMYLFTLTNTRITEQKSFSVKLEWEDNLPAAYKPESVTARLMYRDPSRPLDEEEEKQKIVLNKENNWEKTFDPVLYDGNDENYRIQLFDGVMNYPVINWPRADYNHGRKPPSQGYVVRSEDGTENIITFEILLENKRNARWVYSYKLVGKEYSFHYYWNSWPKEELIPYENVVILQHQDQNGEWEECDRITYHRGNDGRMPFNPIHEETDDNYRVRALNEQGEVIEDNETAVLSIREGNVPLNLQYRVKYHLYGEDYAAGTFSATSTYEGLVLPVEVKWEGGQAPDTSVRVVPVSRKAGAGNWSPAGNTFLEMNAQNNWTGMLENVPYEEDAEYRAAEQKDGRVLQNDDVVNIGGKEYKVRYAVDNTGKTIITHTPVLRSGVFKEWKCPDGMQYNEDNMSPITIVLEHQENGEWKEIKRLNLSLNGDANEEHDGADWRCVFDLEDDIQNYRVREMDANGKRLEDGDIGTFKCINNDGEEDVKFKVSYKPEQNDFVITNDYTDDKTEIEVSLAWDDQENGDGLRPATVAVKLLADGVETGQTLDLTQQKDRDSFKDLNKTKEDGSVIQYTVQIQQDNVITGQDGKLTYSYEIAGDAGNGYTVNLKHTPQTVTYSASVNWSDNNDQDGKRPQNVNLVLKKEGDAGQDNADQPVLNLHEGEWNGQFPAQPAVRDGREVNYTIEQNAPEGYDDNVQKNDGNFEVTYTHEPEKITIIGIVNWSGDAEHLNDRPARVKITLKGGDNEETDYAISPMYEFKFRNLDKYKNKQVINYSVEQDHVNKYNTQVAGAGENFDITNTYTGKDDDDDDDKKDDNKDKDGNGNGDGGGNDGGGGNDQSSVPGPMPFSWPSLIPALTGMAALIIIGGTTAILVELAQSVDVSGKVIWKHGDNPEGNRPKSCTVQLLADGEILKTRSKELTAEKNPGWRFTFTNVAKYYNKPFETKYTVTAGAIKDYTASFNGMTVTYTYTPGKTQAAVNVIWKDNGDQDGIRPNTVEIRLTDGGSTKRTMTLPKDGEWSGTFDDLDDTKTYEADIVRTNVITDKDAKGTYAASVTGDQRHGFFIWLFHTPTFSGVSGKIVWDDENNQAKKRPKEVTVTLMACLSDGTIVDMTTVKDENGNKIPNMKKTVKASDDWKVNFTFGDVKLVSADGGPITWMLKQEPVEGYTTEVKGMTVTNTLKKPELPSFTTHSLLLSGSIGVNFFMKLPKLEGVDYKDSYMEFTVNGVKTKAKYDPNFQDVNGKGYYGFTVYSTSVQMAEPITAVFHYGDGKTVESTYSVKDYIIAFEAVEKNFDKTTRALIHSIADYGHYVQPVLADTNNWTIGEEYKEMDKYYTENFDYDAVAKAVEGYEFEGSLGDSDLSKLNYTLNLLSRTQVYAYLYLKAGYTGQVSVTADGKAVKAVRQTTRYYALSPTVYAHRLDEEHTFVITTDSGTATIKVTPLAYINAMIQPGRATVDRNAVSAIYNYYKAAKDYRAAH